MLNFLTHEVYFLLKEMMISFYLSIFVNLWLFVCFKSLLLTLDVIIPHFKILFLANSNNCSKPYFIPLDTHYTQGLNLCMKRVHSKHILIFKEGTVCVYLE